MLPSLDSLRCFEAAANASSFRAAARAVSLTPAALGQRIRQLEDQLGVRLFDRSTRSLQLTEAGRALVPHARAALGAVEHFVQASRGEQTARLISLTVGVIHSLGLRWVSTLLRELRERHPGVVVNLYFGSCPDLLLRVRNRELDCAVISASKLDPALEHVLLQRRDFVFVGASALLDERPLRSAAEASRHVLLDTNRDSPFFRYWSEAPGAPRLTFRRTQWLGAAAAIHRVVLEGEGVAVLPLHVVHRDLARGRLSLVLPEVEATSGHFRLLFRGDDSRRSLYDALGATLGQIPLVAEDPLQEPSLQDEPVPDEQSEPRAS